MNTAYGNVTSENGDTKPVIVQPTNWSLPIVYIGGLIVCAFWGGVQLASIRDSVADIPVMKEQLSTALNVLGQHGNEFNDVRNQVEKVREKTDRLQEAILMRTDDRFRRADFNEEKARIEKRLEALENGK